MRRRAQARRRHSFAFGFTNDFTELRHAVEQFLADKDRLRTMSPWDHLAWASTLPAFSEAIRLPEEQDAALRSQSAEPERIHQLRKAAYLHWTERKRVTEPAWLRLRGSLHPHVQQVLGPDKNLLLFKEMLRACGSPDVQLPHHLAHGFPLLGKLPRSNTLPNKLPEATSLTRDELLAQAPVINAGTLERVAREQTDVATLRQNLLDKTREEVQAGKAQWIELSSMPVDTILTPRFPADEGWKQRGGQWYHRARPIDDFKASKINEAMQAREFDMTP